MVWRLEIGSYDDPEDEDSLVSGQVELSEEYGSLNFVSGVFTPHLQQYKGHLIMLGASDGSQLIFNPNKNEVLEEGQKNVIMQEEIGHISFKGGSVVLGGS